MQGLNEINLKAMELEENNAMALAIVPPGGKDFKVNDWKNQVFHCRDCTFFASFMHTLEFQRFTF